MLQIQIDIKVDSKQLKLENDDGQMTRHAKATDRQINLSNDAPNFIYQFSSWIRLVGI